MKVKVLIPFTDKHTGKKHWKGETFDASASRINEILKKGKYVELVEEKPTTNVKK